MRRGLLPLIAGAIVAVVGAVMLVVGLALLASTLRFTASAEHADGRIVSVQPETTVRRDSDGTRRHTTSWYPTVEFETAKGESLSFQTSVGREQGAYEVGETLPVAYDPSDPRDARIATFGALYVLPIVFGGLGVVLTPVGAVLLVVGVRSLRFRDWLLRHGERAQGEVTYVGRDRSVRINGRRPFIVRARFQVPLRGESYVAVSDYLWNDPSPALDSQANVTVLFDPKKPKRCVVELPPGVSGSTSARG
ncbi:DUF3592 domain-containing protein [Actinopolymorpha alba]|uniref:DUF3592 domain-containing protein n=1 Tax=Actinopolymorpha alba TaxID=533267 RepID=UPI00037C42BE|nr:DUF3592 domain-containing protein [Actinopolymorpha alba]